MTPVETEIPQVVLFDTHLQHWVRYTRPIAIVHASALQDVIPALTEIERQVDRAGVTAAGFICYEAAPAFDSALTTHPAANMPLVWFGLFASPELIDLPASPPPPQPCVWSPSVSRAQYDDAIARIREHIKEGNTYQVNYTFRLTAMLRENPWSFFLALYHAQRTDTSAFVDTGSVVICSASPELFIQLDGSHLRSRPMKGTISRGRFSDEDNQRKEWMRSSEKNRAENVMIVDMVRNDMGRLAVPGSVRVPSLFSPEQYPTVWQLTSTVECETKAPVAEILKAMFPCASITGAPKARTMEIIRELETSPRHLYTGAIGSIATDRKVRFNVAIRTVVVNRASGAAEYGVGGGITWDSSSEGEYEECLVKSRVLTHRQPEFDLLETLLLSPSFGIYLLELHLDRLERSAAYFDFHFNRSQVHKELLAFAGCYDAGEYKLRLLLGRGGNVRFEAQVLQHEEAPLQIRFARQPVSSDDVFLFHKTTHRKVYDDARAAFPDADDVILWNERGEVTESTLANVVIQQSDAMLTPPVACGLLDGVFRRSLIESGAVRERRLTLDEVKSAERIFLVNSVRRWQEAQLVE